MNCQRVTRLLSACQDGELAPALRQEVEHHLQGCRACRAEWDGLQELFQRLRLSPPPTIDPFFPTRVMAGLRFRPAKKLGLLQAAAYAVVFVTIFLTGFLLQTSAGAQAPAERLPEATFSAVLLEPQDLGLLAVQEDTLKLFNGSDHGKK
jgi:anti-sigma factor RsiW